VRVRLARWFALGCVAALAVGALALTLFDAKPQDRVCTSEALIGPDGKLYGRAPDQGCQFVDEDGNLVTHLQNGQPLCYRAESVEIIDCREPGSRPPLRIVSRLDHA
jgi:hypothetical protein